MEWGWLRAARGQHMGRGSSGGCRQQALPRDDVGKAQEELDHSWRLAGGGMSTHQLRVKLQDIRR